ncbi:MAG: Zn-dependent hydrolase [Candidatus Tectimicrobiota bacterium]
MATVRINGERLWQSLMDMARIGATPRGGVCRVALTDVDRQGRDLFVRWAQDAGCSVEIDQMGNIFARREGADNSLAPVLTGSHLDTQPTGGKFDGVYGVLAALEVIRALNDHQCTTRRPVDIVVWTNEEGSRFAPAMVSSGVFAGEFPLEYGLSRTDLEGITIGQELDRIGYAGTRACGGQPIHAYFEAHIEQGPILEAEGKVIGVVQGLQGQRWFDCRIQGMESHAGTTPMPRRRDALLGAARIVQAVQEAALAQAPYGVGTVGHLLVHPNSRNVIPGRVDFSIDLRHPEDEPLKAMAEAVRAAMDHLRGLGLTATMQEIWYAPPTPFHPTCIDLVRQATIALGFPHMDMISGAGHDAKYMAQICPSAMIFIPCKDGISHNEIEDATPADVAAGCDVLLQAVLAKATE